MNPNSVFSIGTSIHLVGTFTSAPFTTVDQKTTLYLDEQSNKWKLKIEKGGRVSEISEP